MKDLVEARRDLSGFRSPRAQCMRSDMVYINSVILPDLQFGAKQVSCIKL